MRTKLYTAILATSLFASAANAETTSYSLSFPVRGDIGIWNQSAPLYSSWQDQGGLYNCGAWSPSVDTVDFGQSFLQYRDCLQDQSREVTHREQHTGTGAYREASSSTDTQTITRSESRLATGTFRDWQPIASIFTDWENDGESYGYSAWSPAPSNQVADFAQSRSYSQDQGRYEHKREQDQVTGDIRDSGDPILHEKTLSESESRNVKVSWSDWTNVGGHTNCSAWSPTPGTVNHGESFTQNRDCDQAQARNRIYQAGSDTIHSVAESRTITETESQDATGTKRDWQSTSSTFTDWANTGSRYGHSDWTPAANDQTSNFSQARSYSQDQTRYEQKREKDLITGDIREVGAPILQEQTISGTESRSVEVVWTAWVDAGERTNCGAWSPEPATVNYGQTFTQTRDCDQRQTRNRSYKAGSTTIQSTTESRVITETESQAATGTKRDWQPISSSFTAWMNDGARFGHTAWSPSPSTQTAGFTQTRSYSQNQDRYEQKREQDAITGDIRNVGEPILRERTTTGSESRSITVSWSSWSDVGSHKNCGAWTPAESTVNYGQTFTQTRDCDQDQSRNRIYKVGTSTVHTAPETRTIQETESQAATGTKRDWQPTTPTYTSWVWLTDEAYGHTAWSPANYTETSTFFQNRSYKVDRTRLRQERERDAITGDIRYTGVEVEEREALDLFQNRGVTYSAGEWIDVGSQYGCGWYLSETDPDDYFDRVCSQDQERTVTYSTSGQVLHQKSEQSTVKVVVDRQPIMRSAS